MKTLKSERLSARERFVPLPVDRLVEISITIAENWDGRLDRFFRPEDVRGARVKVVATVPEARLADFDRETLRSLILAAGAVHCRAPEVRVVRRKVRRDERHDAEISIEESLRIFAEETRAKGTEGKVRFAAELAREADAGVCE